MMWSKMVCSTAKGVNLAHLNKCVVEDKHNGGEPPCPFLVPEEHLSNVANISDFGMS